VSRDRWTLSVAVAITAALLSGCAGTDRPEGVVERWLIALNQGSAGVPAMFADDALSQRILPSWASKDPGQLDVIEVGRGKSFQAATTPPRIAALVPYRVVRVDGTTIEGNVVLLKVSGDWRVVTYRGKLPGLAVPSEGGPRIGSASPVLWLAAFGVAVLLSLVAVGLMTAFGHPRPQPANA
jgi:hypothetical protein